MPEAVMNVQGDSPPPCKGRRWIREYVGRSVEDRRFDVGACCLAGRLATRAVDAFWSLLTRFRLASVDCVGIDAVAAFVSVCLHGIDSLKEGAIGRRCREKLQWYCEHRRTVVVSAACAGSQAWCIQAWHCVRGLNRSMQFGFG